MSTHKRGNTLLLPTIIIGIAASVLLVISIIKGNGQHIDGFRLSLTMMIKILPLLFFALFVAQMVQLLIPAEVIAHWVGSKSGMKGIFIGMIAGMLTLGGPYAIYPLAVGFVGAGASIGTITAYVTSWSMLSLGRLPMEIGFLGWKFSMIRMAISLIIPLVVGWSAQLLFSSVSIK